MGKKNFRIVAFSLLFAGLGMMIASLLVKSESTKTILLFLTAGFYIAAALQIVIYKNRPKAFDDKKAETPVGPTLRTSNEGDGTRDEVPATSDARTDIK